MTLDKLALIIKYGKMHNKKTLKGTLTYINKHVNDFVIFESIVNKCN